MVRTRRLADWTGLFWLEPGVKVRIRHPRHSYTGQTGSITQVIWRNRRVRIALANGAEVEAGHRSVEVI